MVRLKMVMAGMTVLAIGACKPGSSVCSAEGASKAVADVVREQVQKSAVTTLRQPDGTMAVGFDALRNAVAQITATIEDVRTDHSESSGKADCAGTLRIKFATPLLNDAFTARQNAHASSVEDLAASKNIDHKGDSYSVLVSYHVQPTDDGKKMFARVDDGATLFNFAGEVVASAAARGLIDNANRQAQAQQAQADAALAEQRAATLAAARAENQVAAQEINAAWGALSLPVRQKLLPLQKAWARKKDADCLVEAANANATAAPAVGSPVGPARPVNPAADAATRDIAKITCDTKAQSERARWLDQFRNVDAGSIDGNQPST